MKRADLEHILEFELKVPKILYSVYGESGENKLTIDDKLSMGMWRVYGLNERQQQTMEKYFDTEDEACEYVIDTFKRFGYPR